MAALAAEVAALAPGWRLGSATLAAEGALARALADLPQALIYPFFMAEGWFTRTALPRRLAEAGKADLRRLPCFGLSPGLPDLTARAALEGAAAAGLVPGQTTLLLAAHGGEASRASARATRAMAAELGRRTAFSAVVSGFVEEQPFLKDAARNLGPALCLPFFALRAGHVAADVPEALAEAGFTGALLPQIGAHDGVPGLIAAALSEAEAVA